MLLVDLIWRKVPRYAVKVPGPLEEIGIVDPYPQLSEDWEPNEKLWGWTVPTVEVAPDVGIAIDLIEASILSPGR